MPLTRPAEPGVCSTTEATDRGQPAGRWRIVGSDLDGVSLTVVVVFGGLLEVVTLF
jgi:hypothetical protein